MNHLISSSFKLVFIWLPYVLVKGIPYSSSFFTQTLPWISTHVLVPSRYCPIWFAFHPIRNNKHRQDYREQCLQFVYIVHDTATRTFWTTRSCWIVQFMSSNEFKASFMFYLSPRHCRKRHVIIYYAITIPVCVKLHLLLFSGRLIKIMKNSIMNYQFYHHVLRCEIVLR